MNKLTTVVIGLIVFYVIVQFIYVLYFPLPFISDSSEYVRFAKSAISEGTYYPNPSCLFEKWMVAPVYINYLILLLKINDSTSTILIANILLNLLQMVILFLVVRKLYNIRTGLVAVILYMLYLNNLGMVLLNFTEFFFGIMLLLAIYFYLSGSTWKHSLLCGIFTGLAIGVRPTGWALLIVFVLLYCIDLIKKQSNLLRLVIIVASVAFYVVVMGSLSLRNIDRFEFTSTTGPSNLIMSANANATGVYSNYFFLHDSTYKQLTTYPERDAYMKKRVNEYLREHPYKWISLIPRKIYSTYISDVWTTEYLLHDVAWDFNSYLKASPQKKLAFHTKSSSWKAGFWFVNIWQQMVYGCIMLLFVYQCIRLVKQKYVEADVLLNLFIIVGVGLSIVGSVGNPRYKYNFIILAIILVSPYVLRIVEYIVSKWKVRTT